MDTQDIRIVKIKGQSPGAAAACSHNVFCGHIHVAQVSTCYSGSTKVYEADLVGAYRVHDKHGGNTMYASPNKSGSRLTLSEIKAWAVARVEASWRRAIRTSAGGLT